MSQQNRESINGLPEDYISRIRELARDLAFGVTNNWWGARFPIDLPFNGQAFSNWLGAKWKPKGSHENIPSIDTLIAFGYAEDTGNHLCRLTQRAYELLDKPATPPSVFISYRRSESSALGLLIEARLKMVGNPNPFIDKNLVAGDEWHGELQAKVQNCRYFVCLIGKTTLDSPMYSKKFSGHRKPDVRLFQSGTAVL